MTGNERSTPASGLLGEKADAVIDLGEPRALGLIEAFDLRRRLNQSRQEEEVRRYASQEEMRLGPRSYTLEQAEVIEQAVRERQPLRARPLPLDD